MIKSHYEERSYCKTEEIVDAVICNKCARTFNYCWDNVIAKLDSDRDADMEFVEVSNRGGYWSIIGDDTEWSFHLCEECVIELMTTLKVPPSFVDKCEYTDFIPKDKTQKCYEDWLKKKGENIG